MCAVEGGGGIFCQILSYFFKNILHIVFAVESFTCGLES